MSPPGCLHSLEAKELTLRDKIIVSAFCLWSAKRQILIQSQFFLTNGKQQVEGLIYQLMGRQKESIAAYQAAASLLEKELEKSPEDVRIHSSLGIVSAGLGKKEEALRFGRREVELSPVSKDAVVGPWRVEDFAHIYVLVGEQEEAIRRLDFLLSIPCHVSVPLLRVDPRWDPLRTNPRFEQMLQEYTHQAS